jgi:hypothetical protein
MTSELVKNFMNTHLFWGELTGGRVHSFWKAARTKAVLTRCQKRKKEIFFICVCVCVLLLSLASRCAAQGAEPSINIQLTQCGMWNSFAWLLRDGETRRASWANQPWNYMKGERKKKPVSHTLGNWFASRPGRQSGRVYTQLPPAARY